MAQKTPKILEESQVIVKPLKEKLMGSHNRRKKGSGIPTTKFILKQATKPQPDLRVPHLPIFKLERQGKNSHSQSV